MAPRTFTLNFMGDTMLGRLIDQMFPQHVREPEEARIVQSFRASNRAIPIYQPSTPWGNTLGLLKAADLNILNLETSATTHAVKWPNKVFNYRMHPANIAALQAAHIAYAGLANNHTLDFCEPGLMETVRTLKEAKIAFAGAGETKEEAVRPAVLKLPSIGNGGNERYVYIWAAADHPQDWAKVRTFQYIDYTQQTRDRLQELLTKPQDDTKPPALKVFSVHWGPNYSWKPAQEIRDLAHFLIDECGIDIIHGHSSHHVQGVEKYKGKLIIYGCGDFVDDYALTPGYRNDLSAVWQVAVAEEEEESGSASSPVDGERTNRLKLQHLEIHPTMIERFQARRLEPSEPDNTWVCQKILQLSRELGAELSIDEQKGTALLKLD